MSQYLVAAIDGTKARFLTLEPAEFPEYESSPKCVEHEGLFSSAKELSGQELWANVKTGRNRGAGGQSHRYDDRREQHLVEFERRFAQTIATRIADLAQENHVRQLVLVAEPQILGLMRETLGSGLPKNIETTELAKDLCHLKAHELHEYLANKQILPAQKKASSSV